MRIFVLFTLKITKENEKYCVAYEVLTNFAK